MKKISKGIMIMLIYIMTFSLLPNVAITVQADEKQERNIENGYIFEMSQYEDNFLLNYWSSKSEYQHVIKNGTKLEGVAGAKDVYSNNQHKRYRTDSTSIYDLYTHQRTSVEKKIEELEKKIKENHNVNNDGWVDVMLVNITDKGELVFRYRMDRNFGLDIQNGIIYKDKTIEIEDEIYDLAIIGEVGFYYESEELKYIDLQSGVKKTYKVGGFNYVYPLLQTIDDYIIFQDWDYKDNELESSIKTLKFNNGNIKLVEEVKSSNPLQIDKDAYIWELQRDKLYRYESGKKALKKTLDDVYTDFYVYDENRIAVTNEEKVKMKLLYSDIKEGEWRNYNGVWYYYENGVMQTGWKYIDGQYFYLNNDGKMQIGWLQLGGKWYFLNENGNMQTGLKTINGKKYLFDYETGEMKTGWQETYEPEAWNEYLYLDENGAAYINKWIFENDKWYYLDENGYMAREWKAIDGKWYYFEWEGDMVTGWKEIWHYENANQYYYFNNSGEMQTGWLLLGDVWYHLKDNGEMTTGWYFDGANWYCLNDDGAMITGWYLENEKWYFLHENGVMQKNWQFINNEWYYFYENGIMATNTTIDGWKIGSDGVAVKI